jgi:hypothetical protein
MTNKIRFLKEHSRVDAESSRIFGGAKKSRRDLINGKLQSAKTLDELYL